MKKISSTIIRKNLPQYQAIFLLWQETPETNSNKTKKKVIN
jgi:hypothetical protein